MKFKIGEMAEFRKNGKITRCIVREYLKRDNLYLVEMLGSDRGKGHNANAYETGKYKGNSMWFCIEENLKPTPTEEIHITRKGDAVHCVKKSNGKIIKRSIAICSKEDDFNFDFGANLAFERLTEKPKLKLYSEATNFFYGDIGQKTKMKDVRGQQLYVGDRVMIIREKSRDVANNCFVVKPKNEHAFIMGIKDCCKDSGTIDRSWIVIKEKGHKELSVEDTFEGIRVVL